MLKNLLAIACLAFCINGNSQAAVIGAGAFSAPTLIDFETAIGGAIADQYSGLGITFLNFNLDTYQTSSAPGSRVALKFVQGANPNGELLFTSAITRFGFDASTNPEDDTTLVAYLGSVLVGNAFFDTFGAGNGGSFVGIEFASGFDRVVVQTTSVYNGAIAIDNVLFEAAAPNAVPEPSIFALFSIAMIGMLVARGRHRRRR